MTEYAEMTPERLAEIRARWSELRTLAEAIAGSVGEAITEVVASAEKAQRENDQLSARVRKLTRAAHRDRAIIREMWVELEPARARVAELEKWQTRAFAAAAAETHCQVGCPSRGDVLRDAAQYLEDADHLLAADELRELAVRGISGE